MAQAGFELRTPAGLFGAIRTEFGPGRARGNLVEDGSVLAGLGLRTSTDIAEEFKRKNERARADRSPRPRRTGTPMATSSSDVAGDAEHGRRRSGPGIPRESPSKRVRRADRPEWSKEEQRRELDSVMRGLDNEFAEKERLSHDRAWCARIPTRTKVNTVQEFYKAFHDVNTLPILTCMLCYGNPIEKRQDSPFQCVKCFPIGKSIYGCDSCVKHLGKDSLSPAAQLHDRLGCEHMFPDELKDLTPIEEKLIALNSCYGFIAQYSIPNGPRQGIRYGRHVKGHITVFPNNVQELVANVLPHPLLKVIDEIHVSWLGSDKPVLSDLSVLLSVRRRVVEKALVWLKRHNPLYAHIEIDVAELESWDAPSHGVLSRVYKRLRRDEPSAQEKARTGQLVPPTERGLDEGEAIDIREVLATLGKGHDVEPGQDVTGEPERGDAADGGRDRVLDGAAVPVYETSSSGVFALDRGPDIANGEKLQYVHDALGQQGSGNERRGGTAEVRRWNGAEPYIVVNRGEDFADPFDPRFFAKTFPTLFPLGRGGPRQANEGTQDVAGEGDVGVEAADQVRGLIASRNMSLETWAKLVLQRHGGRFASHHIFPFLVFNVGVRSRNRRASMASVARKDFPAVERIVRSLNAERLERAKAELEISRTTSDEDVNQLLKSLESRLSMRRKIQSLIIRYGIPAIWFTLNPNDITNPIKLRLAAYRTRDPEVAEAFLTSLDLAYKRARLAISDPLSSAIFFYREISLFFKHYVKIGEDSVFERINEYFGAVETNERGSLHVYGLFWLQGNMQLNSVFTEDLDYEAFSAVRAERSVTSDISPLLANREQFAAAFEDEANFCAGSTQIHTHSPTCVKYSINGQTRKNQDLCRFKAPWKLVERTAFTEEGVLQIRRTHSMVNRWNKAIAVGLRHNHDISFIATQCKTMALVFYLTNYATKVEDPVWKREDATDGSTTDNGGKNRTRQFLMRIANRIFTERPLSQVEVVSDLLGYPREFTSNNAWSFVNVSSLYWHSGIDSRDKGVKETVFLHDAGVRISLVQAYPYRGRVLQELYLYDYLSVVKLKRKSKGSPSESWVQVLRKSGEHAMVCFDGYLSRDLSEESEVYYKRAAVQHLAIFVTWESFLAETTGDINAIWESRKQGLPRRMAFVADNIRLLHRSAEDAKRDAKQWAAMSGEADPFADAVDLEDRGDDGNDGPRTTYRSDSLGNATRLIDVLRNAMGTPQVTAGSNEISRMVEQMSRFQQTALGSMDELSATAILEQGPGTLSTREGGFPESAGAPNGFGEQDVHFTAVDEEGPGWDVGPSMNIQLGPSTSFSAAGKQLAEESFTLNRKQSIALRLICRQLDRIRREGGTGKSRIIGAVAALFGRKAVSHSLLVIATSGTAAANINGDTSRSVSGSTDLERFAPRRSTSLRVDGRSRAEWQEKLLLIIDEVSMLGARTLYMVNEQLCRLRGCTDDFGGIPIERSILLSSHATAWTDDTSFRVEQRHQHDKAHALWNKFTTVVMLDEQRLLSRIRHGVQDRSDMDFLNQTCYEEGRRIPWESGITVVTPLNRNRWNLNLEAMLCFQRQRQGLLRIFMSEHKWKDGQPTEEEALMLLSQGDDSAVPVLAIFMFVAGMPIVLVNGACYTALDVVLDQKFPGHRVNTDTILHFGPPAGIVLASETTKDYDFVGMPAGTILLTPVSVKMDCQRKRPWQKHDVQGKTLGRVALELRGARTTNVDGQAVPSQCDAYGLYVQLSRCPSLDGIMLLSRARERDIVGNRVPDNMVAAEKRLEQLSEATIRDAERWDWSSEERQTAR
ncbi:hypothetical protein P152DRAFT_469266 [Eremomyces bilateralis CBS 781.70]|uniref:ATP-dependent DNA helicase n=1 Tax=Eremomyces bilateralis CBS 781.70 TaxID=1392243 RepID=A0A6G1FQ24_9PEZI|nr:uncharacterized protein P152DRAFT_469266 [Eremomyces bilateralis CBS 781.70]KAF1807904.1 hypothetical protein P152DRAFT_469266 [Eremomyces bilateralis CBS 781.70]